jgi:hypothetical protein
MKTLRAFWHYVDNEKPARVGAKQLKTLSPVALQAYVAACTVIDREATDLVNSGADTTAGRALVRDLSLKLCEGFEQMHAALETIREAEVKRVAKTYVVIDGKLVTLDQYGPIIIGHEL